MSEPTPREQLKIIAKALGPNWLDDLLTPEERDALNEHLRLMAEQRRRVEAESRNLRMP